MPDGIMSRTTIRKWARRVNRAALCGVLLLMAPGAVAAGLNAAVAARHPNFSGIWAKTTDRIEMANMSPLTPEGEWLFARNKKAIADSDATIDLVLSCM